MALMSAPSQFHCVHKSQFLHGCQNVHSLLLSACHLRAEINQVRSRNLSSGSILRKFVVSSTEKGLQGSLCVRAVSGEGEKMGWGEYPRLTPAGKNLMEEIAGSIDTELHSLIHPSRTSPSVRSFRGQSGEGSVTLRAGRDGSKVRNSL